MSKTFFLSLFLVCGLVLRSVFENGVMVQIWRDGMSSPTAIQLVTVKTSRSLIGADRASLFKMNQWKCLTTLYLFYVIRMRDINPAGKEISILRWPKLRRRRRNFKFSFKFIQTDQILPNMIKSFTKR